MERITLLGTSGAVTNAKRDNVSFVFSSRHEHGAHFHVLVECGGSAAHKLAKVGVPYERLEDVIITHAHLDHFYGLPGLIFSMIYSDKGRTTPLRIYCPEGAAGTIESLLNFFELRETSHFPLQICVIPFKENAPVLENEHVMITATPVNHVPDMQTLGIRIFSKSSGKSMVYSSDTGYAERLIPFTEHADMLFHECAGLTNALIPPIHSNASQAGKIAQKSEVKKLILIHLDSVLNDAPEQIMAEVRQQYSGDIVIPSDFDEFVL